MKQSPSDSLTPQSAQPLREATQIALQVPLDEDETKELLLCALYIIKNLEQGSGDNFNDDDNDDDSNNNNNDNFFKIIIIMIIILRLPRAGTNENF